MMSCANKRDSNRNLKISNHATFFLQTVESGIVQTDTSQLIAILRQQDAKFQALENQIQGKKIILEFSSLDKRVFFRDYHETGSDPSALFLECRHKNQDYQVLAQRLTQMETRLNLTLQENVDLRATIQNSRRPKRSLERKGRNFLASTATSDFLIKNPVVAFDAYRYYTFEYIKALSLLYGLVYSKSLNAKALKGSSFVVTVFENRPKCLI